MTKFIIDDINLIELPRSQGREIVDTPAEKTTARQAAYAAVSRIKDALIENPAFGMRKIGAYTDFGGYYGTGSSASLARMPPNGHYVTAYVEGDMFSVIRRIGNRAVHGHTIVSMHFNHDGTATLFRPHDDDLERIPFEKGHNEDCLAQALAVIETFDPEQAEGKAETHDTLMAYRRAQKGNPDGEASEPIADIARRLAELAKRYGMPRLLTEDEPSIEEIERVAGMASPAPEAPTAN